MQFAATGPSMIGIFRSQTLGEISGEYQEGEISMRSMIRTWNDDNPNVIFGLSLT